MESKNLNHGLWFRFPVSEIYKYQTARASESFAPMQRSYFRDSPRPMLRNISMAEIDISEAIMINDANIPASAKKP